MEPLALLPSRLASELTDSLLSQYAFKRRARSSDNEPSWRRALVSLDRFLILSGPLVGFLPCVVNCSAGWTILCFAYALLHFWRKEPYHFGLDLGRSKKIMRKYMRVSERLAAAFVEECGHQQNGPPDEASEAAMFHKSTLDMEFGVWNTSKSKNDWRFELLRAQDYDEVEARVNEVFDTTGFACPRRLFDGYHQ